MSKTLRKADKDGKREYELVSGSHTRWEGSEFVRYERGKSIQLTRKEAKSINRFTKRAVLKTGDRLIEDEDEEEADREAAEVEEVGDVEDETVEEPAKLEVKVKAPTPPQQSSASDWSFISDLDEEAAISIMTNLEDVESIQSALIHEASTSGREKVMIAARNRILEVGSGK